MRAWRLRKTIVRAFPALPVLLGLCATAAADPENVHIDFLAPAGCPDSTVFMGSLQARTTRFRQTAPDDQARRFLVRLAAVGSSFSGRLEIRSPDGSSATRRVEGAICNEVSDALALMTALAIDPSALTGSPKVAGKDPGHPTQKAAALPDPPRPAPSAAVVIARPSTPAPNASQPWRWSAGVLGDLTLGVSPSLGYGGQLFVEAEAPLSFTRGPAVRMGIFLTQSDIDVPTGATAKFQWALATVEGCPLRLGLVGQRLTAHPCLALRLGVLRGQGRGISQPRQTVNVWADVGPVLRLRLAVTARWILEAQGALAVPLYRPTFAITDMGLDTTAYSVPRLGGVVGMGVSYRFR